MKRILLIALFISTASFAQKSINNYKYIIVPSKFDFVKEKDKYQTSSLTKFLFNKYGFTAFLDDEELPAEVADNRCLVLTGTVKDESGMFTTKSVIELRDCYNKVVFTSKEGRSKEKDYKKAYHEAIRDAFKSIEALKYTYVPLQEDVVTKEVPALALVPTVVESKVAEVVEKPANVKEQLFAQPIPNGFQLVNMKPEVVFQVLKTNVKDVFVIKDKNGILYKNGNSWFAEYYTNDGKVTEEYQVKF
ncbi:hypothetical protein [uncultured Tenacibaculum sp.]|uniref:hypothetical protein n=1 Tax=uncultured Tenacibaculum sp. TaxID=174713 RepID=UPI00261ADF91|nr:hypothetical protein [uncultured Tenacibaculum sp.]